MADADPGAMVIGAPGESWQRLKLHVDASAGRQYEAVVRWQLLGSGSPTSDVFLRLLDASGAELYKSDDVRDHVAQVLAPTSGVAPAGTHTLEIEFLLRGTPGATDTRRIEVYELQLLALGDEGPRPFLLRWPYIHTLRGFIGERVVIDLTDSFSGQVGHYSLDEPIPVLEANGPRLTLMPNTTRERLPPLTVFASNVVGRSIAGASVYLYVEPAPPPLSAAAPEPEAFSQLVVQYVEPGQPLFAIDSDHLFAGGLPPWSDELVSAPAWVEMPVNGLVAGRCPTDAPPAAETVVLRRTDARGQSAEYILALHIIAPRDRTPTRLPADTDALAAALKDPAPGDVIQLQPGVEYDGGAMNLYAGSAETSAEVPVIVLGAPGAIVLNLNLNRAGHVMLENVAIATRTDGTIIAAKKVRGLRLVNCSLQGARLPVDVNDGQLWKRADTFRLAGEGVVAREDSFIVIDGCAFRDLNTAFVATVQAKSYSVLRTTSTLVADDHVFIQQSTAVWFEDVELLGHSGNHLDSEHRDVIQLANPNQPAVCKLLIRRVFGLGEGQSQGCFIRNEDQDTAVESRLAYWPGNHRGLLIEHSVFVSNSAHGLTMSGVLDAVVRHCAMLGHPDETYRDEGVEAATGQIFIRGYNQQVDIGACIADQIQIELPAEWQHNGNVLRESNVELEPSDLGTIFPNRADVSLPMQERLQLSAEWAAAHPGIGPDLLRPQAPPSQQQQPWQGGSIHLESEHAQLTFGSREAGCSLKLKRNTTGNGSPYLEANCEVSIAPSS